MNKFNSLLLHIPHSSTFIPTSFGFNNVELINNVNTQTDLFTDELFYHKDANNIKTINFEYNRYYCDVERYFDDSEEKMSEIGQGVFYTKYLDGSLIGRTDTKGDIIDIYNDHHIKLNNTCEDLINEFESCLIVDCHSFSDAQLTNFSKPTPDICIGLNEENIHLYEFISSHFKKYGYAVELNYPYSGSIYPSFYSNNNLKSVMIEVNKKCYLKDNSFEKHKLNFNSLKDVISLLLTNLVL